MCALEVATGTVTAMEVPHSENLGQSDKVQGIPMVLGDVLLV